MEIYKGEKYIYLLMGYMLAKGNKGNIQVGEDNGVIGGQNYWRGFSVQKYSGKTLLIEKKNTRSCAEFSRVFEVMENKSGRHSIMDYINENGENGGKYWIH